MRDMDMTMQPAVIVQHCSVMGRLETPVRAYQVLPPRPYAQYPVSVSVLFIEPKQRKTYSFTMKPDNIRYLTIEAQGQVLYDSRTDVPCDMEQWASTDVRFQVEGRGIRVMS